MEVRYTCNASGYYVHVIISDNVAIIKDIYCDYDIDKMKAFFFLIKRFISDIEDRKIKYIEQYVTKEDWELLSKNTSWVLVKEDEMDCIRCETNKFIDNLIIAMGLVIEKN